MGDVIYDVHHFGKVHGISTEASIPVGIHRETVTSYGGAGLVARNILALDKPVILLSVVGGDNYGREIGCWRNSNLASRILIDPRRTTITKERFIVQDKKVLRWNRGDSEPISKKIEDKIIMEIKKVLPSSSLLLISDYRHGILSEKLAQKIIKLAHQLNKEVWVDAQVTRGNPNHHWYRGADFICLNEREVKSMDSRFNKNNLLTSLKRLQKRLDTKNVTIKLGAKGSLSLHGDKYIRTHSPKVKVRDAVGAGDAFFAALASQGNLSQQSLDYASRWAALSTTISGTEPPTLNMLKKFK